ncbi:hypothetical protein [Pseudomonas helmanticensis]|uniref:hypothetical protein n=1 Tax=Pseudomonas helmanticensis TaxID=1471381 RepID=UPI001066EFC0|nr:hypothetical protein [Pseudomonas helmanticensis]
MSNNSVSETIIDLTDFNDKTYNGWESGPAGSQFEFVGADGGFYIFSNMTENQQLSGNYLKKEIITEPGCRYELEVVARASAVEGRGPAGIQYFAAGEDLFIDIIDGAAWGSLRVPFTATTERTLIELYKPKTNPDYTANFDINTITIFRS